MVSFSGPFVVASRVLPMRWASGGMLRKPWPRWVLGVSTDDACRFCRLGLFVYRVLASFRATLFGAGLATTRNANVMASMNSCRWCSPGLEQSRSRAPRGTIVRVDRDGEAAGKVPFAAPAGTHRA